uniref:Uncharacterized protein n=1 Tax=Anguilla anguilla TaxID=7936 RepID=A0A0E9XEU3_ANGAN
MDTGTLLCQHTHMHSSYLHRGMPLWPFVIFGADGQAAIFCACYFIVACVCERRRDSQTDRKRYIRIPSSANFSTAMACWLGCILRV